MGKGDPLLLWWTEVCGDQSPGEGLAGSPDHRLSRLQVRARRQRQEQMLGPAPFPLRGINHPPGNHRPTGPRRYREKRSPAAPGRARPHPDLCRPVSAQGPSASDSLPRPRPSQAACQRPAHTCLETLSHVFFSRKMALRFMEEVISSTAL